MDQLPLGQKPIVMTHYPHMLAEDIEVWSAYLAAPVVSIDKVWYDLHVGRAIEVADSGDEIAAKIARAVSRKRIDAVCKIGAGYWVVEIKPFASMLALGQVISYTRLFLDTYAVVGEVFPVIVCENIDEDLIDEFDDAGILVIEV